MLYLCRMIAKRHILLLLLLTAGLLLTGCSSRALREAQGVVAEADSLRAEGVAYTDSMALAEAYNTLEKWQYLYPTDYARVCYYYGRLLRNNDDPVAAMQVFINGTHSRSKDYHILGRIYSNMANMCRLGDYHDDAYEMYQCSAEKFHNAGDSLLYYYALNNMAFEMAELGKKEEALDLLSIISTLCSDDAVLVKIVETRAITYFYAQQYDSAIYFAKQLYQLGNTEPTGILLCARAYSFLGVKDSAVYYAKQVVPISQDLFHLNNALYILTNDDDDKDKESIRQAAADRADIQKLLEIRQGKLAQAVQLLEQDLTRKPDRRWLYIGVAVVLFIGSCSILYYIWRKRKQHRHIVKELHEKEKVHTQLQKTITNLSQLHENQHLQIQEDVENTCLLLHNSSDLLAELKWYNYEEMCSVVNLRLYGIIDRLNAYSLSEKEIRLCVLILLRASTQQMVDMIPYAYSGLGKFKYTTARKLGTNTTNIRTFILNLIG